VRPRGPPLTCFLAAAVARREARGRTRFGALYRRIGITQIKFVSQCEALQVIKYMSPDWIVAEFFYGFGKN
jgi:hypothetical protein